MGIERSLSSRPGYFKGNRNLNKSSKLRPTILFLFFSFKNKLHYYICGYNTSQINDWSAVTRTDESVKMVHIYNTQRRDRFDGSLTVDRRDKNHINKYSTDYVQLSISPAPLPPPPFLFLSFFPSPCLSLCLSGNVVFHLQLFFIMFSIPPFASSPAAYLP